MVATTAYGMGIDIAHVRFCSGIWICLIAQNRNFGSRSGWSRWKTSEITFANMAFKICYKLRQLASFNSLCSRERNSHLGQLISKNLRRARLLGDKNLLSSTLMKTFPLALHCDRAFSSKIRAKYDNNQPKVFVTTFITPKRLTAICNTSSISGKSNQA